MQELASNHRIDFNPLRECTFEEDVCSSFHKAPYGRLAVLCGTCLNQARWLKQRYLPLSNLVGYYSLLHMVNTPRFAAGSLHRNCCVSADRWFNPLAVSS